MGECAAGTCAAESFEVNENPIHRARRGGEHLVAQRILDYLQRHPQAQDTIEGIVEWWLAGHTVLKADVETALSNLVSYKFISMRQRKDGRIYYSINAAAENSP